MQYKNMNELDLKLALLSGSEISLDSLKIKPYTLKEIQDYGYSRYTSNLHWLSLSVDDFIDFTEDKARKDFLREQRSNLRAFDFYVKLGGKEFYEVLINAVSMIFRTNDIEVLNEETIVLDFKKLGIMSRDEDGEFVFDEERLSSLSDRDIKIIDRNNFDDIVYIVKLQNYIEKPNITETDDSNPADEETRKLMEHMKKMNNKVEEVKKKQSASDNQEIDISDIISAVSSKSNSINKLNIWDFTLYQLYDEYARLELIDNYDFSVKAIISNGAKIKLNHWSSKIK